MFERDQTERVYLIIQIKAKGRGLLIKIPTQNRQTHFYSFVQKTPTQFIHPEKNSTHSAVCEAGDTKSPLSVLLDSKAGAYCTAASHSSGSPLNTVSSRRSTLTPSRCHNTPTGLCPRANLPEPEREREQDLDVPWDSSPLLV